MDAIIKLVPPKIRWDDKERAAFLEAARSFGAPERGDSKEVWQKAQEIAILPNRRRVFSNSEAVIMNAERKKGRSDKGLITTGVAPDIPIPVTPPPAPVQEIKLEPVPEPTPTEQVLIEQIAGKVTGLFSDFLSESILQLLYNPQVRLALRDIVKEMITPETDLQQEQAVTWREPKTPKERLPRIVIGGGPPGLRDLFKGFRAADIRFWGQSRGETPHRLIAVSANADLIYIMHGTPHKVTFALDARKYKYTMWRHSFSELKLELERVIPTLLTPNGEEQ